jgi:transcription antitermination factor NusG
MEVTCSSNSLPWFAVSVKVRSEKSVAAIAQYNGFEQFLPLYKSRRRWSDRIKLLEFPLFPGYVFCRIDPASRMQLLTLPGVQQIVGAGKTPIPIDNAEIAALQVAAQSGLSAEPWPFLRAGQQVLLKEGPLAGLEGLLVEVRKNYRLLLSVTLLQRAVAVEIDREWVTPIRTATPTMAPPSFTSSLAGRSPSV